MKHGLYPILTKAITILKRYLFPVFITLLGLTTAYLFYALWHSEEINPPVMNDLPSPPQPEKLSQKKPIPKKPGLLTVSEPLHKPGETDMETKIEKEIPEMMETQSDIADLTLQKMEARTQELYESLVPDNYEETMQEAGTAFEQLDETVEATDEKLAEEIQAVEEAQEEQISQKSAVETVEEEIFTIPESKDEVMILQKEEIAD